MDKEKLINEIENIIFHYSRSIINEMYNNHISEYFIEQIKVDLNFMEEEIINKLKNI